MTLFAPPTTATPLKDLWEGVLSKVRADNRDSVGAGSASFQSRSPKVSVVGRFGDPVLSEEPLGAPPSDGLKRFATCDVAIGDWDVLLSAVKARLRDSVSDAFVKPLEPHLRDHVQRIRSSVLECVDALDQLHETLSDEFARRKPP